MNTNRYMDSNRAGYKKTQRTPNTVPEKRLASSTRVVAYRISRYSTMTPNNSQPTPASFFRVVFAEAVTDLNDLTAVFMDFSRFKLR